MMDHMPDLFSVIVPTIILLGLLIFVHELGHFLVAKYYKVRVEVFSLGFGKKLFSFRRGDTEYCISAIPLGGYVKMFGDDPSAELSDEDRAGSFLHKPVGQRIAIVLAGPLMNLFFAVVLYAAIALMGEKSLMPVVGDLDPKSPAAAAGFLPGDTITSVDTTQIQTWSELERSIAERGGKALRFEVLRENGTPQTLEVVASVGPNPNPLAWNREAGQIEGLTPYSTSSVIAVRSAESPAGRAGLRTGDQIVKLNSTPIHRKREMLNVIGSFMSGDRVEIEVKRGLLEALEEGSLDDIKYQTTQFTVEIPASARGQAGLEALQALGLDSPEMYVARVVKDTPAAKAGLQRGDKIVTVNGESVASFAEVQKLIQASKGEAPVAFGLLRNGQTTPLEIKPDVKKRMNSRGQEEVRFEIGFMPLIDFEEPKVFEKRTGNPVAALERGIERSWEMSNAVVVGFVRLFQGEVSSKNIGGILSIGAMAKRSWSSGIDQFFLAMAVISINLFVLNLLPVPVLDGGHLIFYSLEAIRGAPLSMKKLELAQKVGAALLVGLMVFALYNDITRLIFR